MTHPGCALATATTCHQRPAPWHNTRQTLATWGIVSICWMHALALAQPVPGAPQQATPGRGGGFGFGLSINLNALAQALKPDERYRSPDSGALPRYEPRQLILSWENARQDQAVALIQNSGGNLLASEVLSNLSLNIAVLAFPSDADATQALIRLQTAGSGVPSFKVDRHAIAYPMQTAVSAPVPGKQYAHDLLNARSLVTTRLSGSVTLGIVDTEVTNVSSLAVANFKAKRLFADSDKAAPADHGNAVVAIMSATGNGFEGLAQGIALRAAGVMREVVPSVYATNTLLVAQALDWLVGEKAQVTNLSLGSANDAVLAGVVTQTLDTGMVLVAAAGNGGPQAPPSYPAAYPGVIAVTAVDAQKRLYARANQGAYIAISAPGVDVWVPVAADGSKGKYMSGTSFASPFVAAAIAQAVAQQPAVPVKTTPPIHLQKLCSKASNIGLTGPEAGCGLLQM